MKHISYHINFSSLYDEVYDNIIRILEENKKKILDIPHILDGVFVGYQSVSITEWYGSKKPFIVDCVEWDGKRLSIYNEEGTKKDVRESVLGEEIVELYDIVYYTLYGED